MKKYFTLILLALLPIVANAYDAKIDGIYYNFSGDNATVTYYSTSGNSYSGAVVIPSTVTYNEKTYSVTSIGNGAFRYCESLTSVTIPNSVTSIGNYAFGYCSGLTSITIPNSVTSIGDFAFQSCNSLQYNEYDGASYLGNNQNPYVVLVKAKSIEITTCDINTQCKIIYVYAFENCSGLTSIIIPNSVTSIGNWAFSHCSGLTSITIPNSVTSIGNYAFSDCSSLESITIPNSVTSIGSYAFQECNSLQYNEYDGAFYLGNDQNPYVVLVKAKSIEITACDINTQCKIINSGAFSDCSSLGSITIPNSVTSIGWRAFVGCSGLTSVTIPNSVTSIGGYAFESCI